MNTRNKFAPQTLKEQLQKITSELSDEALITLQDLIYLEQIERDTDYVTTMEPPLDKPEGDKL